FGIRQSRRPAGGPGKGVTQSSAALVTNMKFWKENTMLFQVIHSHSEESCPGVFPDKLKTFSAWWNEMKSTPGVKVLGGYVSPIEHNFYITLEADDFGAVARALG